MPCSLVHRDFANWLGPEFASRECLPDLAGLVELVPLGHGALLLHRRFGGDDERWELAPDGTVQRTGTVLATGELQSAAFTLLPPYGIGEPSPPLLIYGPRIEKWSLARPIPDAVMPERQGEWPKIEGAPEPWDGPEPGPAGRQMIGLADDLVLDRSLGDGGVRLWRFTRAADGTREAVPLPALTGPPREEFRRGHRLVPLGPGRLLEWVPVVCDEGDVALTKASCSRFNVWTYVTVAPTSATAPSAPAVDPFAKSPLSSGRWADVGEGDEILADEARVMVWTRATGRLKIHRLDESAADPLAAALLLASPEDMRLSSQDWKPPVRAPGLEHILIILQDGRSFDSYFGLHCQGTPGEDGSPPACEEGAGCCEGLPASTAESCLPLDTSASSAHRPNGTPICMRAKMNGGAMDGFASLRFQGCGDPADVACAGVGPSSGAIANYHRLAARGALADRFFQTYAYVEDDPAKPVRVPSIIENDPAPQNLVYLTAARFGDPLVFYGTPQLEQELARVEVDWAIYAGPKLRKSLRSFWVSLSHNPAFYPYRGLENGTLESDLFTGELPSVAVVVADADDAERSEVAGEHALDRPVGYVADLIERVAQSPRYRDNTLVVLTYLSAGGHYDHVRPPPPPPRSVDAATKEGNGSIFYGPRVPLLALGKFARKNHVSHVQLELSSLTGFIEWNWLAGRALRDNRVQSDRRSYRDHSANGIGSLLDPALLVPEGRP